MKINFHANCQGYGLHWFFKNSPDADSFESTCIQNFRVTMGEETREQERKCVEEADILFYHATKRVLPWPADVRPKEGCRLIPLSVFYNGAYFFIENANQETWAPVIQVAKDHGIERAVEFLVYEADLDYWKRWGSDLAHMMKKEHEECVDLDHITSCWQLEANEYQQLLTKNHPSSLLFLQWANMLLESIGLRQLADDWVQRCREYPNIVNLPCEDWVTTAARRHLGLQWGGTDYENHRAEAFAREKLTEWLR